MLVNMLLSTQTLILRQVEHWLSNGIHSSLMNRCLDRRLGLVHEFDLKSSSMKMERLNIDMKRNAHYSWFMPGRVEKLRVLQLASSCQELVVSGVIFQLV